MLTIIQEPTQQVLTGNPVIIAARCMDGDGNVIDWQSARSELDLPGYYVLAADDISLNWEQPDGLALAINFYSAAIPDAPEEFPNSADDYISIMSYYEAVAEIMQNHPSVYPSLRIYAEDNGAGISIHAEVREYVAGWSVQWGDNNIESGTSVVTSSTALSTTAPDGYRVVCDVFMESGYGAGDYMRVGSISTAPNSQGEVYYDVRSILHAGALKSFANKEAGPAIPAWADADIYIHDVTRRWYYRIYELNEEEDTDFTEVSLSATLHCLAGGIAQNIAAVYDFIAALSITNAFLTWKPDKRQIDRQQPEWLPWYNWTGDVAEIVVQLTEYDEEDTATVSYLFEDTALRSEINAGQIVMIPASPRQLDLAEGTIKYSLRVVDATSSYPGVPAYLSQARTYYIDSSYYAHAHYLMYMNSFFCPETLRTTGVKNTDLNVQSQQVERVLPPGSTEQYAQLVPFGTEWADRWVFRTGYLSRLEIESLRELLIYRSLYEITERVYIPLAMQEGRSSFPVTTSRQNLHALEIATMPAIKQGWYSNILIPVADGGDAWLTDAGDYWETSYGVPWLTA